MNPTIRAQASLSRAGFSHPQHRRCHLVTQISAWLAIVVVSLTASSTYCAELTAAQREQLETYAKSSLRLFTASQSNNLDIGMAHTFYGQGTEGQWRECEANSAACIQRPWGLTRGYGSHVNINEVTLRIVCLAAADRMNWIKAKSLTWDQIRLGLETLRAFQTSGDDEQFFAGTFHRAYLTTTARDGFFDLNTTAEETRRTGPFEQSSDDNGLPYLNLLLVEGFAAEASRLSESESTEIGALCQAIRGDIALDRFVTADDTIPFNFTDGVPSTGIWDRRGAEGSLILAAMLLSGNISAAEFEDISASLLAPVVLWDNQIGSDAIRIEQANYHNAMFIPGLRSLHGLPVTGEESPGAAYFDLCVLPAFRSQFEFAVAHDLEALGSQAMTQTLDGYPVFEFWSGATEYAGQLSQIRFAGNEGGEVPDPDRFVGFGSMSRGTSPHAWFVPLARPDRLTQVEVDTLFSWMGAYKGTFHNAQFGWQAVIGWTAADTRNTWLGSGSRVNYADFGRPYETLNNAYSILHIFDALNPDRPLSSFSTESERLAHIAAYFDENRPLPVHFDEPTYREWSLAEIADRLQRDPMKNPDGDRLANWAEYLFDRIPLSTDPDGVLEITMAANGNATVRVNLPDRPSPHLRWAIQRSAKADIWETIWTSDDRVPPPDDITATVDMGVLTVIDSSGRPEGQFRVGLLD